MFGSEGFTQVLYAGYSQSEYDNVISSSEINVAGDGYHVGYSASYPLAPESTSDLALTFGATYLDTANRIDFYGTPYGEENLALFLPRVGLRGSFSTFSDRGKHFGPQALPRIGGHLTMTNWQLNAWACKMVL